MDDLLETQIQMGAEFSEENQQTSVGQPLICCTMRYAICQHSMIDSGAWFKVAAATLCIIGRSCQGRYAILKIAALLSKT